MALTVFDADGVRRVDLAHVEEAASETVVRKDQEDLRQYAIDFLQVGLVFERFQGDRRNGRHQADEDVDARDEHEARRRRFKQITDRIHQRNDGESVEKQQQE